MVIQRPGLRKDSSEVDGTLDQGSELLVPGRGESIAPPPLSNASQPSFSPAQTLEQQQQQQQQPIESSAFTPVLRPTRFPGSTSIYETLQRGLKRRHISDNFSIELPASIAIDLTNIESSEGSQSATSASPVSSRRSSLDSSNTSFDENPEPNEKSLFEETEDLDDIELEISARFRNRADAFRAIEHMLEGATPIEDGAELTQRRGYSDLVESMSNMERIQRLLGGKASTKFTSQLLQWEYHKQKAQRIGEQQQPQQVDIEDLLDDMEETLSPLTDDTLLFAEQDPDYHPEDDGIPETMDGPDYETVDDTVNAEGEFTSPWWNTRAISSAARAMASFAMVIENLPDLLRFASDWQDVRDRFAAHTPPILKVPDPQSSQQQRKQDVMAARVASEMEALNSSRSLPSAVDLATLERISYFSELVNVKPARKEQSYDDETYFEV